MKHGKGGHLKPGKTGAQGDFERQATSGMSQGCANEHGGFPTGFGNDGKGSENRKGNSKKKY